AGIMPCRTMLEHIPVGVDRELQIVLVDRTPDRLAIEIHDDRWCAAEKNRRGIGLEPDDLFREDGTLVDERQNAIEPDHPIVLWNRFGDFVGDLAQLLLGQ